MFFETPSNLLIEPKPNLLLFSQIEDLAKQSNTQIYIISGKSSELLQKYFGKTENVILISNNGVKIQITGKEKQSISLNKYYDPNYLKMCVATRMENFVLKTAGSYISQSEVATTWHFENVEKEFADTQKAELSK